MVYYRTYIAYSRPSHPTKSDNLSEGHGKCDALRSYTRRWKNITRVGADTISARKPHHATTRYD
jgi:hypothetical protein